MGFTAEEAGGWDHSGFDIEQAEEWRVAGFSLDEAVQWRDTLDSVDLHTATVWRNAGFCAAEAERMGELGYDVMEARRRKDRDEHVVPVIGGQRSLNHPPKSSGRGGFASIPCGTFGHHDACNDQKHCGCSCHCWHDDRHGPHRAAVSRSGARQPSFLRKTERTWACQSEDWSRHYGCVSSDRCRCHCHCWHHHWEPDETFLTGIVEAVNQRQKADRPE